MINYMDHLTCNVAYYMYVIFVIFFLYSLYSHFEYTMIVLIGEDQIKTKRKDMERTN